MDANIRYSSRTVNRNEQSKNFCAIKFVCDDPSNVRDAMSPNNSGEQKADPKEEIESK